MNYEKSEGNGNSFLNSSFTIFQVNIHLQPPMAGEAIDKGKMTLSSKAALKVIAHALKFPDVPVLGLLVGTQESGVVTNALPLYHSLVYPTLAVAVQQVCSVSLQIAKTLNQQAMRVGDSLCGNVQ